VTSKEDGKFSIAKGMGLVNSAFSEDELKKLRGTLGIGWLFDFFCLSEQNTSSLCQDC
jgi:glutamine phosphoribosylpyrophosphate amidotransferase